MRLSLTAQAGIAAATSLTVSSGTPKNAVLVNPAFPGTSFEFNTFPSYCQSMSSLVRRGVTNTAASATDGSANQYSINLINEIFKRTGARPIIRVGGTTGYVMTHTTAVMQLTMQ